MELAEAARIDQGVNPLPYRELAAPALAFDAFGTPHARTQFSAQVDLCHFRSPTRRALTIGHPALSLSSEGAMVRVSEPSALRQPSGPSRTNAGVSAMA